MTPPRWNDPRVINPTHPEVRRLADRLAEQGVDLRTRAQVHHGGGAPGGRRAILPTDEREAKYGRPDAVVDHRNGQTLVVMGGGQYHAEQLVEWADEARHYGLDRNERERFASRPDFNAINADRVDRAQRAASGRRTYGARS
jgi:hypothetical protein